MTVWCRAAGRVSEWVSHSIVLYSTITIQYNTILCAQSSTVSEVLSVVLDEEYMVSLEIYEIRHVFYYVYRSTTLYTLCTSLYSKYTLFLNLLCSNVKCQNWNGDRFRGCGTVKKGCRKEGGSEWRGESGCVWMCVDVWMCGKWVYVGVDGGGFGGWAWKWKWAGVDRYGCMCVGVRCGFWIIVVTAWGKGGVSIVGTDSKHSYHR